MHLIKYEKNQNLLIAYKERIVEYLDRSEYIKKNLMPTSNEDKGLNPNTEVTAGCQ